jgi:hypothetical protein
MGADRSIDQVTVISSKQIAEVVIPLFPTDRRSLNANSQIISQISLRKVRLRHFEPPSKVFRIAMAST